MCGDCTTGSEQGEECINWGKVACWELWKNVSIGKIVSDQGALESELRNSGLMGQQKGDTTGSKQRGDMMETMSKGDQSGRCNGGQKSGIKHY